MRVDDVLPELQPHRAFPGRSRILFRLLALLPIAYEVACMLLKVRSARGLVQIPEWAIPLLTVKPPMTFVLFVALALFVKTRELRFRRHGKTHEEYQAFLKTRRNSWNFAVFLAIMAGVFSQIRTDILRDIIRQTYAAEIIACLLMTMVAFSFVLKYYEDAIHTFWDGLWYCFAVVTTIGFGDIAATSVVGRLLTVILGIYGIVVVALITSIIVNFYGEIKKEGRAEGPVEKRPNS